MQKSIQELHAKIDSINQKGIDNFNLNNYNEAELHFKEALETVKIFLGVDDFLAARQANNMAVLYRNVGRFNEAEILLIQALKTAEKIHGEDDPDTAPYINNLGNIYYVQERYSDAEPLYERALEISKKFRGENNRETGTRFNNLGVLYHAQNRYPDSEFMLTRALSIMESFGYNYPDVGVCLDSLANLYNHQNLDTEAEFLFKRIIQTNTFDSKFHVNAFNQLAKISYKKNSTSEVNRHILDAWKLIAKFKIDSRHLDKEVFLLALTEIDSWALLDNPFKKMTKTSSTLRERLNLTIETSRPDWTAKLHFQYTEFHVKWMKKCLKDNMPEPTALILSLASGWRVAQFILDEIDTDIVENTSTLPVEVLELKKWRKQQHSLRINIQELNHPTKAEEEEHARFSPIGLAQQEKNLKNLYVDWDNAYNNMYSAQQELAKNPEYAALATNIGIDITELRAGLKSHQSIALCIDFTEHNFKGILLVFSETAKTQWIDLSCFDTVEGLKRLNYFNRKFGGGRGFRRGEISSTDISNKAKETNVIEYSPEDFWPEFQSYIKQGFWDELGNFLEGIEELTLITQGNMHSLPLEMCAPQNLTLVRYPSITLYNMQQKIKYEKSAADANPVIGLACSNDNGIWFAKQEAIAIAELYKNNSLKVIENYDFLAAQENITAAHLAGHGFHNDAHAHQAGLDMGGAELWTQPKLLSSKARPKRVFISACVAGKTTENSEGDVYGIAAAFMLRGTRELSAAIVNMNDPWMFLVGYRVEEYLFHNPTHSQYTALKHAKDDLVNQKPIPLVVLNKWKERIKDDLSSIINTSAPESDGRNQQLDEFIKFNTTLQIDEEKLRKDFLTVLRRDTKNLISNYEFTFRNTPPEPILGSLLYGILHFGK